MSEYLITVGGDGPEYPSCITTYQAGATHRTYVHFLPGRAYSCSLQPSRNRAGHRGSSDSILYSLAVSCADGNLYVYNIEGMCENAVLSRPGCE